MPLTLAIHPWIVVAIVVGVASVVTLAVIVLPPSKRIREEPPLDDDVETRLLLGDDPQEIAEDEDAEASEEADEATGVPTEPSGPAA